jgi:hypothetical protein
VTGRRPFYEAAGMDEDGDGTGTHVMPPSVLTSCMLGYGPKYRIVSRSRPFR